jgi:hypothetical protein
MGKPMLPAFVEQQRSVYDGMFPVAVVRSNIEFNFLNANLLVPARYQLFSAAWLQRQAEGRHAMNGVSPLLGAGHAGAIVRRCATGFRVLRA